MGFHRNEQEICPNIIIVGSVKKKKALYELYSHNLEFAIGKDSIFFELDFLRISCALYKMYK